MGAKRYAILFICILIAFATDLSAGDMVAGKGFPIGPAAMPPRTTVSTTVVHPSPNVSATVPQTDTAPSATGTTVPIDAVNTAANGGSYENQPMTFPSGNRPLVRAERDKSYSMPSIWPAFLAVAVVCGFFCTILWLVKKYVPGHRQLFNHPAIEILGRTHLDQRRYVSLLRVGKRVIVVGVSPDEIRSLSEITDEAEVTGILEVARPKTEAGLSIFQRLFQKNMVKAEVEETKALADAEAEQLTEQMAKLREQVKQIKKSGVVASRRSGTAAPASAAAKRPVHVDTMG